jgi:transposase
VVKNVLVDDRIAALETHVAGLINALAERDLRIAEQAVRIAELEKLLGDSRRGGKRQAAPFSKGDPVEDPKRPGRKTGDAHGRHGHRQLPPDAHRTLDALLPESCPCCGGALDEIADADQYQTDLGVPAPVVTRFRVRIGRCRACGHRVQGHHAEQTSDALGAASAQIGPAAKAWAAWLHYGLGLSFVKCSKLLARLGIDVTAGALCTASQTTGTALVPVQADLVARANQSKAVTMDETGWRINGHSAWLWVATSPDVTVYHVADDRSFDAAKVLIDADYPGVVIRDGWAVYRQYSHAAHQTCTAHLLRRCHELVTDLPAWARGTPRQVADILHLGLAARDEPLERRIVIAADLRERVELLAEQAHPHDENRKLVKHLGVELDALFTYLTIDGVEATNWRGETAIRPAVVNRKVFGGNRTPRGAGTQGRIMSVLVTANQRGIDAIDYLVRLARAPTPTAIPLLG